MVIPWPIRIEIPAPVLLLGLIVGLSYAIIGVGLSLIYKSSRIINLAHGEIGALAAAMVALLVNDYKFPYWGAALLALIFAAVLGATVELTVIRRLFRAPRLMLLVATMGLAQLFLFFTFLTNDAIDTQNRLQGFPLPFRSAFAFGPLALRSTELLMLVVVPLLTLALVIFLRYTAFGVAVRASAENADSARLVGIPTKRVSTFVWMVAAVLSATTALLLAPGRGIQVTQESLGPDLLMRALAAAVIGGMVSLPRTFLAGIAIGVVEKVVIWNFPDQIGVAELILFIAVLGALMLQARRGVREVEASSWSFTQIVRPIPRALQGLAWVRSLNWGVAGLVVAVACVVPLFLSNATIFLLTTVLAFAIVGLSVTVLTGYAGQISLGQVAFFGIGAATSYQLTNQLHLPFLMSLLLAGMVGAGASVLIGLPALRMRGLLLALTTLGFALVTQKWLLARPWMAGPGVISPRPFLRPFDFGPQRAYYFIALGALLLAVWLTRNVLHSGAGRNFLALRDNEAQGAAFTIPVIRTKISAFAFAGFLAAFGGAIYGHGIQHFQVNNFPVSDSLRVVAMTILGGLGSIPGTIAGAVFVTGVDRLVREPFLRLLSTSVGLLLVLMYLPGGFAQIVYGARDRFLNWLATRVQREQGPPTVEEEAPAPRDEELLERAEAGLVGQAR
jgi:ABC-type branched-subunit amino acid transport system permease subunit